jgi:SAM-dependent methyltransferase
MDDDIDRITARTLANYERVAEQFFEGTREHDVSQNIAALLDAIAATGAPAQVRKPYAILDFGCGPGRDLKTFASLGHVAVGLDGAEKFAAMARQYSGCDVWRQNFADLDLPAARFDGIFANASLFHVPAAILPRVLAALFATLKPGGVLFSSNPRGDNEEGWHGERYGSYHDYAAWEAYLTAAGFTPIGHYYRPPGLPRERQPWLASLWRKPVAGSNAATR